VDVPLTDDLWAALNGAHCAALVTRHREYQALDLRQMKGVMCTPALVDGRNTFNPKTCQTAGMIYRGVGKG
jgi:UDPglucose 6-dehydrogenase